MKVLKNPIFMFILGGIIFTAISAYATIKISADDVEYSSGVSIKSKIDELYTTANNIIKDDNLYLYWLGNEYPETTGGWESTLNIEKWSSTTNYAMSLKSATKNADNYDLSTDDTFQYSPINTKNKIDCTEYSYINIYYSWTTNYTSIYKVTKDVHAISYAASDDSNQLYKSNFSVNPSGKPIMVSYPISCSESGYIAIYTVRGNSNDSVSNMKVYGVVLSKQPMGIR